MFGKGQGVSVTELRSGYFVGGFFGHEAIPDLLLLPDGPWGKIKLWDRVSVSPPTIRLLHGHTARASKSRCIHIDAQAPLRMPL